MRRPRADKRGPSLERHALSPCSSAPLAPWAPRHRPPRGARCARPMSLECGRSSRAARKPTETEESAVSQGCQHDALSSVTAATLRRAASLQAEVRSRGKD